MGRSQGVGRPFGVTGPGKIISGAKTVGAGREGQERTDSRNTAEVESAGRSEHLDFGKEEEGGIADYCVIPG